MSQSTDFRVRLAGSEDREAAYHVCLKTGDFGGDGEPYFSADPDALGRIYVGPYLKFAPELSYVLEDDTGVCGYALAALDSRRFFRRYEEEWRPELCAAFPCPKGDPDSFNRLEETYYLYHHPDYFTPEPYDSYPSHCHIDLLPRAQSKGCGRRMMNAVLDRLQSLGSPGVHLGMSAHNERAGGFYEKLGFHELVRTGSGSQASIYMGLSFSDCAR
ncbi:MAG: GNAT family N-acetyltransferase [Planctomycetota bacterium]